MKNRHHLAEVTMPKTMHVTKLLAALAIAVVGSACGEAIDINRVAPGAVNKSVFTDEWYARAVVVDKQFGSDMTFVGAEGSMERIKWEITENYLVGFRSYEKVPGSDPSNPGEQSVIVMFPIMKHFDIRRQYNTVNGVESNVVEENDFDRPWWQRDYIRVGWNTQHADAWDIGEQLFIDAGQNGVDRTSNQVPTDPWKVRIGDKLLGATPVEAGDYLETVIDGTLAADPWICYYLDGLSSCNGAQVKVKYSFKKVPKNNDYVAFDYPDYVPQTTGSLVLVDSDNDPTNDQIVLPSSAPLMVAANIAIDENSARICTTAEMDRDGTRTMQVVDDTMGVRLCNTDRLTGDVPSSCRDAVVRCDVARGSQFVAITPNGNPNCDPNHHSPDDCIEITQSVFSRFGYFRTDRYQLDRENGSQYNARERLINRHNIWAKSTDDNGRSLPMSARAVKPIVYVLNAGFPTDLIEVAQGELAADWNLAFKDAVAAARGLAGSHKLKANLNDGIKDAAEVTEMFKIEVNRCNIAAVNAYAADHDMKDALTANNISAVAYGNLEEACAVLEFESQRRSNAGEDLAVFTWQQLGDLRYNFLNWASKAELAGPLGYGPSAADPITGEIVSANANIYGASIDTYANWGADIVQLLNGEITTGDVINGTVSREHIEGVRNRWSKDITRQRVDGFMKLFDERTRSMSDSKYFKKLPITAVNGGLDKLRDSGIEEEFLMTSDMLRLFGNDAAAVAAGRVSTKMIDNARPSNWGRQYIPQQMVAAANAKNVGGVADQPFAATAARASGVGRMEELSDYLGRKNYCYLSSQVEPAIADLADQVKDLGLDRDAVVKLIRSGVFRGVTAHELGHTFGLRHNFEGSADAMNYFPQYHGVDADGLPEGKAHLLGAVADTTDKYALQYSSIMDYHQRFNSDFHGIGLYDKAAIKLGYAETVEVFDETNGAFVARDWITQTYLLDPDDFASLVSGPAADSVIDDLYDDAYEAALRGDESSTLDIAGNNGNPALAPHPENLYKRRDIPLRDWYRQELLRSRFTGGLDESECAGISGESGPGCMDYILAINGLADDDGRMPKVTVPYSFCSDEFAFGGNLTCNRYDMGPTSADIVKNAGEMYEFYYPFDAFRRDRVLNPFSSWSANYLDRLYQRTYQPMLNAYRFFYYYRRAQTLRIYPAIRDWGTAALQGMDFFVRVLGQPEPGTYCNVAGTYVPAGEAGAAACAVDSAEVGLDQGRIYNSNWDSQYDFQPINLGNYWDKALALQAITSSDAFFFRDFSQETNRGAFSIGYYRVFQNEMLDLFGAVIRDDTSVFAPRLYDEDGDGKLDVVYQSFLKTGIYGEPLADGGAVPGLPIRPATSYQLRSWAAVFGTVSMTSTLDQTLDFAARSRITLAGQPGEAVINTDPDGDGIDNIVIIEFTDPLSQMVYRSVAIDGPEHSVGYRMLEEAKDFAEGPFADAVDALTTAEAGNDAAVTRAARIAVESASAKLNEKTQIIDFMVYLGDSFEFPGG